MERKDFFIEIIRELESYDYKYDKSKNDYQNNTKNNSLDTLILYNDRYPIFICKSVQTISNHPSMVFSDSVVPGGFQIKCFVDQGGYNTEIHGIINAKDFNDQAIDKFSMQEDNGQYIGRWLIHSNYYKPLKKDTKGYSGGCFTMNTPFMETLNKKLKELNINPGDIINGHLREV